MINNEILFRENISMMLSLISEDLYWIAENKSMILFHDDNSHKLFFIYLHDYLRAQCKNPEDWKSDIPPLFELTKTICKKFKDDTYFTDILEKWTALESFLSKERIYTNIYISPHELTVKTNLFELICFAGNDGKHNYFRLSWLQDKLCWLFERNNIKIDRNDSKVLYDHLEYFMEALVENKLNYHQTKIIELLWKYFLAINRMLNSETQKKMNSIMWENHKKGNFTFQPSNLSPLEEFYWDIRQISGIPDKRLIDLIPETDSYLQLRD